MSETLMSTYSRLDVSFVKGDNCWLFDNDGNRYLDAVAGVAVCNIGHANPAVAKAVSEQASTLIHTSNLYQIKKQTLLGDKLTTLADMEKVFFCNSGAEANEAAIKLARLHGHKKGISEPAIIVMENSFHGRTLATLSATGNRKVQAGFEPLVSGFVRAPYNNIQAIQAIAANNHNISAILVEPVQGEGGVRIPDIGYLKAIRKICDDNDWLMMLDEIQTGMCRTGSLFAFQQENITPDVMTLAKGLGNGVPIGACLANKQAASLFSPGSHGSTFGGNLLACSAALAVLEQIDALDLNNYCNQAAEKLISGFSSKLAELKGVTEIRNKGLLIGIELDRECTSLVAKALNEHLLINVTAGNVIRLIPPLTIDDEACDLLINKLSQIIIDFLKETV